MKPSIASRVPGLIPPPIQEKLADETGLMRFPWVQWALSLVCLRCVVDTHLNRVAADGRYRPGRFPVGSTFRESDRGVEYIATLDTDGQQIWAYRSGVMEAPTLGDVPLDLGADDEGFQVRILNYGHVAQWDGSGWLPIGNWGGYVQHFCLDPVEPGWVLCNGGVTNVLQCSAGVITEPVFTTPNEAGTYRKSGAAYTGTVNSATTPAITGDTGDASGGTPTGTVNDFTHSLGSYAGGLNQALNSPATHGHTFTGDPLGDHHHDAGTLALDSAAEPANIEYLPYFRR